MGTTRYYGKEPSEHESYSVVFMDSRGLKFERFFKEEREAFRFANRVKHSRNCILISCPDFS